jgi:NAD(P)-dependent dehydrogenase (short-subunit alcohol dehydrogenase family)
MDLGLKNKLAFVSGSTAEIGFAIANALAGEGTRVVVNGRTQPAVDAAIAEIRSRTGAKTTPAKYPRTDVVWASNQVEGAGFTRDFRGSACRLVLASLRVKDHFSFFISDTRGAQMLLTPALAISPLKQMRNLLARTEGARISDRCWV